MNARKKPCASKPRRSVTIRLFNAVGVYFKAIPKKSGVFIKS